MPCYAPFTHIDEGVVCRPDGSLSACMRAPSQPEGIAGDYIMLQKVQHRLCVRFLEEFPCKDLLKLLSKALHALRMLFGASAWLLRHCRVILWKVEYKHLQQGTFLLLLIISRGEERRVRAFIIKWWGDR